MRRKQKQFRFLNLIFFGAALSLILFLNFKPSGNKSFQWTTVRYKTSASSLPEARGICPGLAGSNKPALVVARTESEDAAWLRGLNETYHLCVYSVDAPVDTISEYLRVPANRGHEAMVYLTFLIDNYEQMPLAGAVFIHGSRWAWHNDHMEYDNKALLSSLNTTSALASDGYHNLRCDWSATTCSPAESEPQGSIATNTRAMIEPWNYRVLSDAALPRSLAVIFGHGDPNGAKAKPGRNDAVRSQCCAQFIVARENVWQHSRDEYVALRQWLLDSSSKSASQDALQNPDAAPPDDLIAGRVLSYVWHILFLKHEKTEDGLDLARLNRLACPTAAQCYCRLYNKCDLKGCTKDYCPGQYQLPAGYKLPANWADTHS